MSEDESSFAEEMRKMKEEMAKMKKQMEEMKSDEDEELNIGRRKSKGKNFKIEIDNEDFDFDFEGVDDTINDYLGSVMEGVAENLKSSMEQMTRGFNLGHLKHEVEKVKHEMRKNQHELRKEAQRMAKEARKMERELHKNVRSFRFQKLSEEELELFYETAPNLATALSDEKKLRLLKALEKGPMYQKDLSESTDIKGGTFKHHMDALMEVKYVSQEAVRGRYLITQLGVEALKLSEMLFRRFIFVTESEAEAREIPVDIDEEIDHEINVTAEAVDDLQNEEEEG